MNGDGRGLAQAVVLPNPIKQLFLAKDFVRVAGQKIQQLKLLIGQRHLLLPKPSTAGGRIQTQGTALQHCVLGRRVRSAVAGEPFIPADMRQHPGHQLAGGKGLNHIVVRTNAQALDLVQVLFLGTD